MYAIDECINEFIYNQSTFDATRLRHDFINKVFAPVANLGADLAPKVQQKLADFYLNYKYTPENLHNSSYTQYYDRITTDVKISFFVIYNKKKCYKNENYKIVEDVLRCTVGLSVGCRGAIEGL